VPWPGQHRSVSRKWCLRRGQHHDGGPATVGPGGAAMATSRTMSSVARAHGPPGLFSREGGGRPMGSAAKGRIEGASGRFALRHMGGEARAPAARALAPNGPRPARTAQPNCSARDVVQRMTRARLRSKGFARQGRPRPPRLGSSPRPPRPIPASPGAGGGLLCAPAGGIEKAAAGQAPWTFLAPGGWPRWWEPRAGISCRFSIDRATASVCSTRTRIGRQ
jgi:hypothetical protein